MIAIKESKKAELGFKYCKNAAIKRNKEFLKSSTKRSFTKLILLLVILLIKGSLRELSALSSKTDIFLFLKIMIMMLTSEVINIVRD